MSLARLTRSDFLTLKTLKKEQGRFFILTLSKYPGNKPKFASVVSKKTAHRANVRNTIKRRLRALVREIGLISPLAYVFTAKRSAADASFQEIRADVENLLVKVEKDIRLV
jgi:ribonuclease P protein component